MGKAKLLSEVIGDLLEREYTLDFEVLEYTLYDQVHDAYTLRQDDFIVDEVYRCREYEGCAEVVYVFAISSAKYKVKGITLNTVLAESTISLGDICYKLREAFSALFKKKH